MQICDENSMHKRELLHQHATLAHAYLEACTVAKTPGVAALAA